MRALKPKPSVNVASAFVSQLTCLALLAVDERRYLEAVVPLCSGHVVKVGKLRLIPLDIAVAKLRELGTSNDARAPGDEAKGDEEPAGVNACATGDQMLARWGLRRAAGSR